MEIGIVGLGLIGGSLAKAISQNTDNTVYGTDLSEQVVRKAILVNAIEQPLTDTLLTQCDIVIVALYPQATVDYVKSHADLIKDGAVVVDCGGIKKLVCDELWRRSTASFSWAVIRWQGWSTQASRTPRSRFSTMRP